ncbi:exodeoxyribonuclease V subunit gamma [Pseudidiomarina woesei]|uniref:RecBCD enzyme subunit RecC n=1 Tax=Pseudidiomarina woesei TaxID=1381080 RepID=A0A0K6H4G5_9GAMM|nr:exodeoxyribonuclease V subunit gamma [Pseudidiomarina woesei]CUA85604.1 DNA helicase/exodeoxyribonuclease V, gamma subunit [Pseudidiomarina woesei]
MSNLTPGFIVAHSHRLQDLTDLVVKLNRQYPLPPLANEAVLVQSNGIAQWLKQHLAADLGIAAMVDVMLPARFQWQAYRAVLGDDIPRHSPFDKNRLTWRLMRILPAHLHEPEFATLRRYMADDTDSRKCFQLCERLADLFDQYQVYRAEWLSDWAQGVDAKVPETQRWQPLLWRYVLADVGDEQWNNRALLHQHFIDACERLTASIRPVGIPPRVVVFGISSLPKQSLEVLRAISRFTQVVLCVHNPCQFYWADIIDGKDIYNYYVKPRQQRRHSGATADADLIHATAHPLLASWGKQGRDYIRLLDEFDDTDALRTEFPTLKLDLFDEVLPESPSILDALRHDILHLNAPEEAKQRWQQTTLRDDAVAFHCAHSPQREVEILHDQLLARFAADPSLEPRDVMVMVPDIDRYAPHIEAVFGRLDRDDPRYIPYSLADQGARHRHPMLIALEYALTINQQRASASELFDILQVQAVQARFGLNSEQLAQLQRWADGSGVRWGLNGAHRQQLNLPDSTINTWLFGLQRMLLGYALGDSEHLQSDWQGIEPFGDIDGLEADIAGGLYQFVQVLINHANSGYENRSAQQWANYLNQFLMCLFAPEEDADVVMLNRLQQHLQSWLEATESAGLDEPITLTVVLESWLAGVDDMNLNQRFMAGKVNFATLMPMRAIPFKCVCLLGMNDGDYPRAQKPFDFDLMAQDPLPGDRSRREDDRYLFLEAILSAQHWLYISWQGRSIRDNSEKPAAVVVNQLLEHLERVYGGRRNGKPWVLTHPLQPFSQAYFTAPEPQAQELFTYASEWHVVHKVANTDSKQATEHSALTPYNLERPLTIKHLADFIKEPARLFTQLRLQSYLHQSQLSLRDDESFTLDNLTQWQLLNGLFEAALPVILDGGDEAQAQATLQAALAKLQRAGDVPFGAAGVAMKNELAQSSELLFQRVAELCQMYPHKVATTQVAYTADNGYTVEATFSHLRRNNEGDNGADAMSTWLNLHVTPSKIVEKNGSPRPKYGVQQWAEHLLLNTQNPTTTKLIGSEGVLTFAPLQKDTANTLLNTLLSWLAHGLQQPLGVGFELALEGLKANYKTWQDALDSDEFKVEHDKVATFFEEGGFKQQAHSQKVPYLTRFFPNYATLIAAGQQQDVAEAIYRPLLSELVASGKEAE